MKISYEDLFDMIAEDAIEILVNHDDILKKVDEFSHTSTQNDVLNLIREKTVLRIKSKSKKMWKMKLFIAAIIIIAISAMSFALTSKQPQLISEKNKILIEDKKYLTMIVKDSSNINPLKMTKPNAWKESNVIKRVNKDILLPQEVKEFEVVTGNGEFIIPQMIFWNGDMIILTKQDNAGWQLSGGDKIIIDLEMYDYKDYENRYISLGYVYNGKLIETNYYLSDLKEPIEFVASKNGEYHFCLTNVGSYSVTFKGSLWIEE